MKNFTKINRIRSFIVFTILTLLFLPFAVAQENTEKASPESINSKTETQEESSDAEEAIDLGDDEAKIMTEIYKSNDSSSELDERSIDSPISGDTLSKDDLLGKNKESHSKLIKRIKEKKTGDDSNKDAFTIYQWRILLLLAIVLVIVIGFFARKISRR